MSSRQKGTSLSVGVAHSCLSANLSAPFVHVLKVDKLQIRAYNEKQEGMALLQGVSPPLWRCSRLQVDAEGGYGFNYFLLPKLRPSLNAAIARERIIMYSEIISKSDIKPPPFTFVFGGWKSQAPPCVLPAGVSPCGQDNTAALLLSNRGTVSLC